MCLELNIYPNDTITLGHKKSKNPRWSITIGHTKEVKKNLDLIQPEKFKEPFRRSWLGLKLILFSAPQSIRNSIEIKIEAWKNNNGAKRFTYSLENKEILKIWLEEELFLNKDIKNIFGFEFNKIITNEMIEMAIKNALFDWRSADYRWDSKNNEYVIRFPNKIRNIIIDYIEASLNRKNPPIHEILTKDIKKMIIDKGFIGGINPFHDIKKEVVLTKFYNSLIIVIKEIKRRFSKKDLVKKISSYHLIPYFKELGIELAFGSNIVRQVCDYVKNKYPQKYI